MVHCDVMCTTHICLHVMAIEGPLQRQTRAMSSPREAPRSFAYCEREDSPPTTAKNSQLVAKFGIRTAGLQKPGGTIRPVTVRPHEDTRASTVLLSAPKMSDTVFPTKSQLFAANSPNRTQSKKTEKAVASARRFADQLAAAQDKQKFYSDRNG